MTRSLALAYWQMRRIARSRAAVMLVVAVPAAGIACHAFLRGGPGDTTLRIAFPAAALLLACALVWIRSYLDRLSGFFAGLDSTPTAGAVVLTAHLFSAVLLALVQTAVFAVVVRAVG